MAIGAVIGGLIGLLVALPTAPPLSRLLAPFDHPRCSGGIFGRRGGGIRSATYDRCDGRRGPSATLERSPRSIRFHRCFPPLVAFAVLLAGCHRPVRNPSVPAQSGLRQPGIRQVGADSLDRFVTAVASPSGAFQCLVVAGRNGPGRIVIAAWPDILDATSLVHIDVTRRPEAIRYDEVRSPVPFRTISVPTARA